MKNNYILFLTFVLLSTITFSAERPPQPTKRGVLDVLPAELRLEQVKAIASPPLSLKEAIANIKTYYLAHPPSRNSVGMTKAILTHLMKEYHLEAIDLQRVVDALAKRKTMMVFQNEEMKQWIQAQIDRLGKEEQLGEAVRYGEIKKIKELLTQGVNVNAYHRSFETPLSNAFAKYFDSKNENKKAEAFKIIELLVNSGANSINFSGATLLSRAIFKHSTPLVTLLLNAGENPNFHYENQPSPLAGATYFLLDALLKRPYTQEVLERKAILKLLLDAGANPNAAGYFSPSKISYSTITEFINLLPKFPAYQKDQVIKEIYKEQK